MRTQKEKSERLCRRVAGRKGKGEDKENGFFGGDWVTAEEFHSLSSVPQTRSKIRRLVLRDEC